MYGSNYKDPYFFRETMPRTRPPRTRVERSLLDAGAFVRDFAIDNPHMTVTKLRFSNVLGDDISTTFSNALRLPVRRPRSSASTRACSSRTRTTSPARCCTRRSRTFPGSTTSRVTARCRGARCARSSASVASRCRRCSRTGRPSRCACCASSSSRPRCSACCATGAGVDNSPFKRTGFRYQYSTAGTVDAFARSLRLEKAVGDSHPAYKFERDVETFFRHSPAVLRGDHVSPMPLHVERRGRVAVLTLDDPERRNALSQELVDDDHRPPSRRSKPTTAIGALVVTGAPPAFCSGADVSALTSLGAEGAEPARRARHLRRVPPRPRLPAPHDRRGERSRGRRRPQPRARLRRPDRRDERPLRLRGSSASASTPAGATPGCSTAPSVRRPRRR